MDTKTNALLIFNAAVAAVHPSRLVPAHLFMKDDVLHIFDQEFLINGLQNIYVIGAGKASAAMAKIVEDILGDLITAGIVVTKYEHALPLKKIICLEAAHPVPDEQGVDATLKTLQLLQQAGANDIIICLISGGASSLWIDEPGGASLADIQQTFQLLLKCGATIDEVNTIRKHLSSIKGGQLVQYARQARWFSFIISDVPGDDLSVIASGPTVPDTSTFADAKSILEKYNLTSQLPATIFQHINDGCKGIVNETPTKSSPVFNQVYNKVIGNNSIALKAARDKAVQLGYHIALMDGSLQGDAATVGRELILFCKNYRSALPACLLLGGETTVTVRGSGKGGRNQQMALSAGITLASGDTDLSNKITFLSAGTDGTDGPTDAAGAIVNNHTVSMANEMNLDAAAYLKENDAYHFFEQTGGLIKTGATQTNVMDVVVVIIEKDA